MIKSLDKWQFTDEESDLAAKESAAILINRIGAEKDLEFSSVANYVGQPVDIELAPGNYEADITLTSNERIVIPEGEKCGGVWPLRKCEKIQKIDFGGGAPSGQEQFSSGGLRLNFTITPADLQKEAIVFYVVSIDIAEVLEANRVIEDLEQFGKIEDYSSQYKNSLMPVMR